MSMTIRELADLLGVSKTAIRKYLTDEFRAKYTETDRNGVIVICPDGCKVVADSMGRTDKLLHTSETEIPETEETSEYITIPRSVLSLLESQLQEKDSQLAVKDSQIADLVETIKNMSHSVRSAQSLHAGTIQAQLESAHGDDRDYAAVSWDTAPAPDQKPGVLRRIWNAIVGG